MRCLSKSIVSLIIAAAIHASLPLCAFADIDDQKSVTKVPPGILTTPPEKIPVEQQVKKKTSKWWYLCGAALLLIPALGSGGGGGDDDKGNGDTGTIVIDSPAP